MSDMKCPFCGKLLDAVVKNQNDWIYSCGNPDCEFFDDCDNYEQKHYLATPEFWQELISTKKQLEIAVDALTRISVSPETMMEPEKVVPQLADLALDQITALEQKE